jgi:hypothetical protein
MNVFIRENPCLSVAKRKKNLQQKNQSIKVSIHLNIVFYFIVLYNSSHKFKNIKELIWNLQKMR